MNKNTEQFPKYVALFAIGMSFGMLFGSFIIRNVWVNDAIKAGVGQYNPISGKFEWIKPVILDKK